MKKQKSMREFVAQDGVHWGVEVRSPGASNAMLVFHHPDGRTSRKDRYAWVNWQGPEARSVTARIDPTAALAGLSVEEITRHFRRSMPVAAAGTPLNRYA